MLPSNWLAILKDQYPKRDGQQGWFKLERLLQSALSKGYTWEQILLGVQNYRIHCGRKGQTGTEYVLMASTFFGRDCHFAEWSEMDMRTPAQKRDEEEWRLLEARATALGFTTVDRSKGLSVARIAIERAEGRHNRQGDIRDTVVSLAQHRAVR